MQYRCCSLLKAIELWGFVSIKQGEIVEDGCCLFKDKVFDEAKCVFFLSVGFCFKDVLGLD